MTAESPDPEREREPSPGPEPTTEAPPESAPAEPSDTEAPQATPKKSAARRTTSGPKGAEPPAKPARKSRKDEGPRAPRRPTSSPHLSRLLRVRAARRAARPRFTRQAEYRYFRVGRDEKWRPPRGMQSKQRRHYGYRSQVVSVGFGSPRAVRGLTPTGFRPVVVRTVADLDGIRREHDAAVIARTVGVRRRLVIEEVARKKGILVLNPLARGGES